MMRLCDGTDPNLLADTGGTPCACGLTFDDVQRTVIYPHTPICKPVLSFGSGEVWAWPIPCDGEIVPDVPPQLLGTVDDIRLEFPDDPQGGTDTP